MNEEQSSFLEQWQAAEGSPNPDSIPIFCEENGKDPVFTGHACVGGGKSRAKFVTEAPSGLWLGGGAVMIYVPQGIITVPDRRHGGNAGPAAQGWARYHEGGDLSKTALREFNEEVVAYILAGEDDNLYQTCTEVAPAGIAKKGKADAINLELDEFQEYGRIELLDWCRNEKDRAWIYVGLWDLRELERAHRLRLIWDDDFPGGRRPGTNPRVLGWKNGQEVGRFEGLQGYLPNDMNFHPVVDQVWEKEILSRP